jgi:hypothetical protein
MNQDYPWLEFEIIVDGVRTKFTADPAVLHAELVTAVKNQIVTKINPETPEETKTKIRVVKATIKAFLMAAGDILLDFVYGAKNYPKRGKKDDIYEWYINLYAKAALDIALQGKLILYADRGEYGQATPIKIDEIRPVSVAGSLRGDDGSEGEGTVPDGEDSSTARLA